MANLNDQIAARNYALAHGMSVDAFGNPVKPWNMWNPNPGAGVAGVAPVGGGAVAGGLAGASPAGWNPASGGVPGVTDPGTSMTNLLNSIMGNIPGLTGAIGGITGAQNKALRDQYSPDYFNILSETEANTLRRSRGDITDLLPQLQTNAAEAALASGVPGSDAFNSKLLRDMGLTRYQVENQALDSLNKIKAATPVVAPYDPQNLVPNIQMQMMLQQLADTLRAAPIPESAYQRTMQNIMGGLGAGQGAGYGRGFNPGVAGAPVGTPVDRSLVTERPTVGQVGGVPNPVGAGWGDANPAPWGAGGGVDFGPWQGPPNDMPAWQGPIPLDGGFNPGLIDFGQFNQGPQMDGWQGPPNFDYLNGIKGMARDLFGFDGMDSVYAGDDEEDFLF